VSDVRIFLEETGFECAETGLRVHYEDNSSRIDNHFGLVDAHGFFCILRRNCRGITGSNLFVVPTILGGLDGVYPDPD
jgi:hypothetical protein